jgi:hypothetical protein
LEETLGPAACLPARAARTDSDGEPAGDAGAAVGAGAAATPPAGTAEALNARWPLALCERMQAIIGRDLLAGRKEDYNTAAGLCFLYERAGGKVTPAMEAAVVAQEQLLNNPFLLQLHAYFDGFVENDLPPPPMAQSPSPGANMTRPGGASALRAGSAQAAGNSPTPRTGAAAHVVSGVGGGGIATGRMFTPPPASRALRQPQSMPQLLRQRQSPGSVLPPPQFGTEAASAGGAGLARREPVSLVSTPTAATPPAADASAASAPQRAVAAWSVVVRVYVRMRRLRKRAGLSIAARRARIDSRSLTHQAFYNAFMARYIGSFTSNAAKRALELLDVDADGVRRSCED